MAFAVEDMSGLTLTEYEGLLGYIKNELNMGENEADLFLDGFLIVDFNVEAYDHLTKAERQLLVTKVKDGVEEEKIRTLSAAGNDMR